MMMREMPAMTASSYTSSAVDVNNAFNQMVGLNQLPSEQLRMKQLAEFQAEAEKQAAIRAVNQQPKQGVPIMANVTRRLVQVFIADPDENVPLSDCLLFQGEPKLTDLTDQELFFEVDIKTILDTHNQKRTGFVNKAVKERTEHLEPARIRDLKMTVVTIAQF